MQVIANRVTVGVALLAVSAALSAATRGLPEQVVPQMLGVNIHFTGANHEQVAKIAEAGFRFVRTDLTWSQVEKTRGSYDFAAYDGLMEALDAKGIRPLFILDYGNPLYDNGVAPRTPEGRSAFAAFAGAAAARYKDRGALWEIWNEPNGHFWRPLPSPDAYVALVKETSASVKAADPEATIVGPATGGIDLSFVEKCFRLGLLEAIDVVSVHPYRRGDPESATAEYTALRNLTARYAPKGKAKMPIISGEWGYTTVEHPEGRQAQYLARMFLSNLAAQIPLSIWYDWRDDGTDPKDREHHFGTVYPDLKPKPSYAAVQTLARVLDGCKFVGRLGSNDDEYTLLFKGPQGYRLAAWTTGKEREASISLDAASVTVVSIDGKRSGLSPTGGKLGLKLSQSPVYVEVGQSERLALEEAVQVQASVETRWRLQDVVTVTVSNPVSRPLKGTVTLSMSGQKPMKKRFSIAPSKNSVIKFTPEVEWDGRSRVVGNVSVEFAGLGDPVSRTVDLGTGHRISAKVACPLDRVLEFRISSPARYKVKGKVKLFDVKGLKLRDTSANFTVESQTVVGFTLDEPAPKEFSFGYDLVDSVKGRIFRSPALNYTILEDFSNVTEHAPVQGYDLVLDGDSGAAGKASAEGAERDTPYTALAPLPSCLIKYDLSAGRRSIRLSSKRDVPMPESPVEIGVWIDGDGKCNTARCRLVDSSGQTFEPSGFEIDWNGWRYKTMSLDGRPDPPLKLDAILLLDTGGRETRGSIYLGPVMVVSEPTEASEAE